GCLVPGRDVGQGCVEQSVQTTQHVQVQLGEVGTFGGGECRQVGNRTVGRDVHLDRPVGGRGHERGPVLALGDDTDLGLLLGPQDVGEQVATGACAVLLGGGEDPSGAGGDEGKGVDLSVRVVQGHPDLGATVLETVDLFDAGLFGQGRGAIHPGLDDGAHALRGDLGEGGVVVGTEHKDLAVSPSRPTGRFELTDRVEVGPTVRGQGREPVLEGDHVVVGHRDLGGVALGRGAQGAVVGRWQVGACLPVGGDDDPFAQEGVETYFRAGGDRRQLAGVGQFFGPAFGTVLVEIDDLTSVGQVCGGF